MKKLNLPAKVITLDCDGTIFDPWACCNKADDGHLGTTSCRHLRRDTIKRARQAATRSGAEFVVLSWRFHEQSTADWLAHVGIPIAAEFTLISPDLAALREAVGFRTMNTGSQARYKSTVVLALRILGVEVVESYDDNLEVCRSISDIGVKAVHVKHLATVDNARFNAHRYGGSSDPAAGQLDLYNKPIVRRLSAFSATVERAS